MPSDFPETHPPLPTDRVKPPQPSFRDPASHSYPGLHFTDQLHLDLHLDPTSKTITAKAFYRFLVLDAASEVLTLDVRSLDIDTIRSPSHPDPLSYTISNESSPIGGALQVSLPPQLRVTPLQLEITYTTSGTGAPHPAGGAMDWLSTSPATADAPFGFTQCQAIHARSIVPCQDTPAVKAPYSALVSIAAPFDTLPIVMSAQRVPLHQGDRANASRFECNVPIPSYLIAFAFGKLEWRKLSSRCAVWALPSVVEKAKWEFENVEQMLQVAEEVAGRYVWGRYDLLVLPPSFPYGGMENPFLTFVTPTLLSGDRSLVSVVVHEISHSWAGNLVSCQDWRHLWVNEGFTVKLERRILKRLYGSGREGLDAIAGRQTMNSFIKSLGAGHKYTSLVSKLEAEEDPDDYFSCIPYEKGYSFLSWLEYCVERETGEDFHEFLRTYFTKNRYQSSTSVDFIHLFKEKFPEVGDKIDFDTWLHGVGQCPDLAPVDTSLVDAATDLARNWLTLFVEFPEDSEDAKSLIEKNLRVRPSEFQKWDPKQKLCFLYELRAGIDAAEEGDEVNWNARAARIMDTLYDMGSYRNSEIRFAWVRLALLAGYFEIIENVKEFVSSQGRMKFVRPLFNDLHKVYPKGTLAKELFATVKPSYHSIALKMIERDLSIEHS